MSKTTECPSCAMEVEKSSKTCPICGNKLETHSPYLKWTALVLALIMLYFLIAR